MGEQAKEPSRPVLTPSLTEDEFRRWYWTLAELKWFARSVDVRSSGSKADVAERIAAKLAGRKQPVTARRSTADGITGPLSRDTVIPANQRATEDLRRWFHAEIGSSFRFNGHMRALLRVGGVTLGDAVDHWYTSLGTELPPQSESLEFNRFTKAWHEAHPDTTPQESREAWSRYRALPADQRPPIADV